MKGRLSENVVSQMTIVNPPPVQEMKSEDDSQSSAPNSSANNNGHTNLEMQAV